ncbi:MAG: diguanylate cyclase response regulator [Moraxellaceae bacterium]|nr:MAG: diguanylate cyclase response regulator [Moraxellaceae bacterium]
MKPKALVIEPTKLYGQLLTEILSDLGIEVFIAVDGKSALSLITKQNFDFACISLYLPDDSGINLCEKIRQISSMKHIPIVMLTSEQDKETLNQGLGAGITEILQKSNAHLLCTGITRFVKHIFDNEALSGNVLYIDDNQTSADIITNLLSDMGLKVTHKRSAENAFYLLKTDSSNVDLVLTDLVLEGCMTGIALLSQIRDLPDERKRTPVLIMTNNQDPARKIELLKLGANDYVSKPIMPEELRARVKTLITNKQLIDQVQAHEQEIRIMAETDQLTQLFNRHRLAEMAPIFISQAIRQKHPLSTVVIDIDFFKAINDTHGHGMGDLVLASVGKVIKENCRDEDFAARFGGEEFVLILPYCNQTDAFTKAETLRKKIEQLQPQGLTVTASFGVSTLSSDDDDQSFDQLFSIADKAVYASKENGRNQVSLGQPTAH